MTGDPLHASSYLLLPVRSEAEVRDLLIKRPIINVNSLSEFHRLNAEVAARAAYAKTPEGIAERAQWRAFLDAGLGAVMSGGTVIYEHKDVP